MMPGSGIYRRKAGEPAEWDDILCDLDRLQEITLDQYGSMAVWQALPAAQPRNPPPASPVSSFK
jgi:hypothetical protein